MDKARIAVLVSGGGTNLFNTYNMGVGMSIVVKPEEVDKALEILTAHGETAYVIGKIVASDEKITIV